MLLLMCAIRGSPPRVRGEVSEEVFYKAQERITPACAGRSAAAGSATAAAGDHPRVCGEKSMSVSLMIFLLGSPPRVRGEAFFILRDFRFPRITPACAGRRGQDRAHPPCSEDHPRVCGEKLICVFRWKLVLGSPPRVRGEGIAPDFFVLLKRITPACAGRRCGMLAVYRCD